MYPSTPDDPGDCKRTYRRTAFPFPGSVATRTHTCASGPYSALERHAVFVVDEPPASWPELTCNPVSPDPITPPPQRPPSDNGFSFERLKASTVTNTPGTATSSALFAPAPAAFTAATR